MPNRDLVITLRGNEADLLRAFKAAQTGGQMYARELTKIERDQMRLARAAEVAAQKQRDAMTSVGTVAAGAGAAVLAGLGLATKAAMDWESAWAGVTKTVGGTAPQMNALEGELRDLAKELPATHQEIAAVAEAAGALGIKRESIVSFTRTMIMLGTSTDLTADQAANALARISNVMGTSQDDVDRFGAALVALGNDGASTESEIVTMAQRIAGAGHQIGLSEGDVLGFASALSSVGIEAEAGGSSISTFFIKVSAAVNAGGADLNNFAQVAGMSADDFATKFRTDAAGALVAFVEGLGKVQASGGDTFGILDALGLSEIRLRDAMLRTAGAGDLLRDSIHTGNQAWRDNSALTEEAEKRYETTAMKLQIARNQVTDFAINVGETFLPIIAEAAQRTGDWVGVLGQLPEPVQKALGVLGGLAGAASLAAGAFFLAAPKIAEFRNSLDDLPPRLQTLGRGLSGAIGLLGGPWGAALGGAVLTLGWFVDASARAQREQKDLADAGRSVADAIREQNGAITDSVRVKAAEEAGQLGLLKSAKDLGIELGLVTDAVLGQGNSMETLRTILQGVAEDNRAIEAVAIAGTQKTVLGYNEQGHAALDLLERIGGLRGELQGSLQDNRDVADASRETAGSQRDGAAAAGEHAAAQGELNIKLDDGKTAAESLKEALDGLTKTHLTADEATIHYLDTVQRATQGIKDHGVATDLNTEAGRRNRQSLIDVAQAAQGELIAMIDTGAAVSDVKARHDAMRDELIRVAGQMGFNQEEAQRLTDRYLGVPGSIDTVFSVYTQAATDATRRFAEQMSNTMATIRDGNVTVQFMPRILRAAGGPIFGPGGETSDDIPLWASHNEHVWTAQEVRGAGGHGNVARLRKLAAAGQIPGFARGGAVLREDVAAHVHTAGTDQVLAAYARFLKDQLTLYMAGPGGGAGVERWRGVGLSALAIAGQSPAWIGRLLMQMASESGGNPTAVNRIDSNWRKGTPSVGLMQVIGPTYRAHHHPAYDLPPYLYGVSTNPLANVLASTRYTLARYGSLNAWQGQGYDLGGIWRSGKFGWNASGRPERVLSPAQTAAFERLVKILANLDRGWLSGVVQAQAGAALARSSLPASFFERPVVTPPAPAGQPMVQAEDGSWVPASFYGRRPGGPRPLATILAESGARARQAAQVTVGPVYVSDAVDIDLLADRLAFRATAASFG